MNTLEVRHVHRVTANFSYPLPIRLAAMDLNRDPMLSAKVLDKVCWLKLFLIHTDCHISGIDPTK